MYREKLTHHSMTHERGSFEVGLSRHAPKVKKGEEPIDEQGIATQEVDMEAAGLEIEERAAHILQNLEQSPEGTILAFAASNIERAGTTKDLFENKLKEMIRGREDIVFVELGENEEEASTLLENMRKEPQKKFILSGLRDTWLIGWKEGDPTLPARTKWNNKLHRNEDLLGKVWSAHQSEIPALVQELQQHGVDAATEEINAKEFQMTPEEIALRFVKWIKGMKKIGGTHFPERSLILEGISHNLRSDYTMLALLDEDISLESINRVLGGKFRKPFERSSIVFNEDGSVHIEYRGIVKEYTSEEFQDVTQHIRQRMKDRRKEWGLEGEPTSTT